MNGWGRTVAVTGVLAVAGLVGWPAVAETVHEELGTGQCPGGGCPSGMRSCGNSCVDVSRDRLNCGTCGRVCAGGQVCSGGQCLTSCQTGLTNCGGKCVNFAGDRLNCGSCGSGSR